MQCVACYTGKSLHEYGIVVSAFTPSILRAHTAGTPDKVRGGTIFETDVHFKNGSTTDIKTVCARCIDSVNADIAYPVFMQRLSRVNRTKLLLALGLPRGNRAPCLCHPLWLGVSPRVKDHTSVWVEWRVDSPFSVDCFFWRAASTFWVIFATKAPRTWI